MKQGTRELWLAFIAIVIITLLYLFVALTFSEIPPARSLFGHALGILGFILMLMTETLYSYRKRSRRAYGRMASWLQFHIFTGIVGPYMVLLHSSWKANGIVGVVLFFTIVVVLSGFVGRYIYTAVPRTADGAVVEARDLEAAIAEAEKNLAGWKGSEPDMARELEPLFAQAGAASAGDAGLIFSRGLSKWRSRLRWWRVKSRYPDNLKMEVSQLEELVQRRTQLERQMATLGTARKLLSIWHSVHIPLGVVLFFTAFVHIIGAIYFATLLR